MENPLMAPALKYRIVKHFCSHNFKNGNHNILSYLQLLENADIRWVDCRDYDNDIDSNVKAHISQLRQTINNISIRLNSNDLLCEYNRDPQLLIENELNVVLGNISNNKLLIWILYFFELKFHNPICIGHRI